ncbi:hypothetical protein AWW66_26965 [Micromonospora rosaria]|uniref:Putative zinc-finger domain-containing protein n=1 Tax=Micromonospora rosaria TaxID=47874 RepID=A0A136PKR2_9ACTN|nr:zf-HC2 domain-containing protein [Micromonospora rosaria]KXK58936.1 hypothetical protein AWW66_26965 [Micromonospora rosaria]
MMRTSGENPTAEHAALALYLIGALDDAERVAFEEHLAGCGECLSAAGDMGSVTSALGGLAPADWAELADLPPFTLDPTPSPDPTGSPDPTPSPDATGSPGPSAARGPLLETPEPTAPTAAPSATPAPVADAGATDPGTAADIGSAAGAATIGPAAVETVAVEPAAVEPAAVEPAAVEPAAGRPVRGEPGDGAGSPAEPTAAGPAPVGRQRPGPGPGPRAVGSVRPGGTRPGAESGPAARPPRGRPTGGSRRRRFLVWGGVAAAAVAVALAGGLVAGFGLGDRHDVVLTATGEARDQGVSLSATITTDEDRGSTIRISATGLRQGLRYRLFAVTRDGSTHVVRDWTASTGTQEVTGELPVPVDDLAFVTVGLVDGTAVVTAPISR